MKSETLVPYSSQCHIQPVKGDLVKDQQHVSRVCHGVNVTTNKNGLMQVNLKMSSRKDTEAVWLHAHGKIVTHPLFTKGS